MTKIVIDGGIYIDTADVSNETVYRFMAGKAEDWQTYVLICPHRIEVETDNDPRLNQVAALERTKRELTGRYVAATAVIDKKISSLLAIENGIKP